MTSKNARTTPQSRGSLVPPVLRQHSRVGAVAIAFGVSERARGFRCIYGLRF
jgi:hypothetical protein